MIEMKHTHLFHLRQVKVILERKKHKLRLINIEFFTIWDRLEVACLGMAEILRLTKKKFQHRLKLKSLS